MQANIRQHPVVWEAQNDTREDEGRIKDMKIIYVVIKSNALN